MKSRFDPITGNLEPFEEPREEGADIRVEKPSAEQETGDLGGFKPLEIGPGAGGSLRAAYTKIKERQGFSAVPFSDLLKEMHVGKEDLHKLVLGELKAGRADIHHSTLGDWGKGPEMKNAGMNIPGHPEPFTSITMRSIPEPDLAEGSERAEEPAKQSPSLQERMAGELEKYLTKAPVEAGTGGAQKLVVARQLPSGKVVYGKPGQIHADLMAPDEPWNALTHYEMGFATPNGKFLSRQQALDFASKSEPKRSQQVNREAGLEASQYVAGKAISADRKVSSAMAEGLEKALGRRSVFNPLTGTLEPSK